MKKLFIKVFAIFTAVFSIITCYNGVTVNAATQTKYTDAYLVAKEFLTEYYFAIDQLHEYDFSEYIISENFLSYINNKVECKKHKTVISGNDDMQNYKLSFSLKDSKTVGDYIVLTIFTDVEFNYKGADFDSAYSETSRIIVSSDFPYAIIDCVTSDSYDISLRGDYTSVKEGGFWANIENETSLFTAQQQLNCKIFDHYNNLDDQNSSSVSVTDNSASSTQQNRAVLHSLNRSAMVTWVNNNYNKSLPSSGNTSYVSTYYDFSTIPGAYDCTNFISHALLAGGAVEYNTGNRETGWFYNGISVNNRSASWSSVSSLHSFLTTNTTKGPAGTDIGYSGIYAPSGNYPYAAGDILQFHSEGSDDDGWIHSSLITGYTNQVGSSTWLEPTVTYRSSSGSYGKNIRQSDVYPGENRRVIKLSGYYS